MEKIDWQEITEELGEDRWRDDWVNLPRQSRLLLSKFVQEDRFLSRDSQQIYYGPDSQKELYDAAKTAYNSLMNPIETEFVDMVVNGNLTVNTDDLVVNESDGRVGIGTAVPSEKVEIAGNVLLSGTNFPQYRALSNLAGATTWSLVGSQAFFSIRDVGAATNIFQIYNGAPGSSLQIGGSGGILAGQALGGDKGVGTVNLQNVYYVNGLPVVQGRKTGWSAATGTASRATFSTSTVTIESLAQRLKALIDDLIGHGLIGG